MTTCHVIWGSLIHLAFYLGGKTAHSILSLAGEIQGERLFQVLVCGFSPSTFRLVCLLSMSSDLHTCVHVHLIICTAYRVAERILNNL